MLIKKFPFLNWYNSADILYITIIFNKSVQFLWVTVTCPWVHPSMYYPVDLFSIKLIEREFYLTAKDSKSSLNTFSALGNSQPCHASTLLDLQLVSTSQQTAGKARLKNHVRREDSMCRRRHKTAYWRRQLQIGQRIALDLSTKCMNPPKTHIHSSSPIWPSWFYLVFGFFLWADKQQPTSPVSDDSLGRDVLGSWRRVSWRGSSRQETAKDFWGRKKFSCCKALAVGLKRPWLRRWRERGWRLWGEKDDLLKAFIHRQWNYYQCVKTRLAPG